MGQFSVQTRVNAPKDRVWAVLADLGGIYRWNPGVKHSRSTSEAPGGEGATRHCDLASPGGAYLEERAFDWREGEAFKIDVYESNLPLKRNVVAFSLQADGDGATIVSVSPEYELKFGPIGLLLDRLFGERQLRKGMAALLAGLKHYLETGEEVGDALPAPQGA